MANAFGSTPDASLEAMLRMGADRANAATGAAQGGVGAAQSGLAQAQSIGNEINSILGNASRLAGDSARIVNSATADVDALKSLVPQVGTQVSGISQSASNLSNLSSLLQGKAGDVSAYAPQLTGLGNALLGRVGQTDALASQVQGIAAGMQPYSDSLSSLADHLFGHGHDMVERANSELDQATGLRNLDPASSANAAYWRQIFDAVNPETYAARSMADTQAQMENANAQTMREIARRGGSLTSGAAATLRQNLARALATATAAAASKGRKEGYSMQGSILEKVGTLANQMMQTGTSMFNSGIDAEDKAGQNKLRAAQVQEAMGDLYKSAADMFGLGNTAIASAGSLFGKAADIEKDAASVLSASANAESAAADARSRAISGIDTEGGMYKDAASLTLSQANALNDTAKVYQGNAQVKNQYLSNLNTANRTVVESYGTLASAMDAAARYYLNAAATEVGANTGRGGGGGGGGGVRVGSSSSSDENDFWENTGHDSTWWINNDPEMYKTLALQANGADVNIDVGGGE